MVKGLGIKGSKAGHWWSQQRENMGEGPDILFSTFNFKIIIGSQEVAKSIYGVLWTFHLCSPMVASCMTGVKYQNQKIDIGIILASTILILFSPVFTCTRVCVCVCSFMQFYAICDLAPCKDLCNHHHSGFGTISSPQKIVPVLSL